MHAPFRILMLASLLSASALAGSEPAPTPAPAGMERVVLMHAEGTIVIEPSGAVDDVRFSSKLAPELQAALDRTLRGWHFGPVKVGGESVRAEIRFLVMLAAAQEDGHYRIRIDGTRFGLDATHGNAIPGAVVPDGERLRITKRQMAPPVYPRAMQQQGQTGKVLLAIRIAPDGRVAEAAVLQTLIYDIGQKGSSNHAANSARQFEQNALAAARRWTFNVPPGAEAWTGAEMTGTTEVEYMLRYDTSVAGQWVPVLRGPKRPISWMPTGKREVAAVGTDSGGGLSALESPYRLAEPVDGTPVM